MIPQRQSALLPFLEKLERRCEFSDEEAEAILTLPFTSVHIQANRDFVHEGTAVDTSCFVLDGMIGAFKQDRRGHRQVVSIHIRGDMVDLHSVPVPAPAASLQALVPTTVLRVPHQALREIAIRFPNVAFAFWRETVVDAGILMEWVMNVGQRDARSRMAHFLCELAYRCQRSTPEDGMEIPYAVTQFSMADILGMTAVHINRTLQRLRSDGLIQSVDRSIQRIVDWRALARLGEFDPSYLHIDPDSVPAAC